MSKMSEKLRRHALGPKGGMEYWLADIPQSTFYALCLGMEGMDQPVVSSRLTRDERRMLALFVAEMLEHS